MSDQIVSIEAICNECRKEEYFSGDTASEARQSAYAAGWRSTPDEDPKFGLCPKHAGTSIGADLEKRG